MSSNSSSGPKEYQELSVESRLEQERHAETIRSYEIQKRARSMAVPTAVEDIKTQLRSLGQPITLFGEDHADRRERLREVMAKIDLGIAEDSLVQAAAASSSSAAVAEDKTLTKAQQQKEVFYSAANELLIQTRRALATLSFQRAQIRVNEARSVFEDDEKRGQIDAQAYESYQFHKDMVLNMSQFGDDRPLSNVRYSKDGTMISSGSLQPVVKLWDAVAMLSLATFRGHHDRITATAWQPASSSGNGGDNQPMLLASSSADGSCILWDCRSVHPMNGGDSMEVEEGSAQPSPKVQTFKGHSGVVASCDFHPFMPIVGTASHDLSWRLWDIETGQEMLLQDGHLKECSSIAFHPDGSLVLTTDSGGVALLWDLRSGHMIQGFQGHIKKITNADFHPNGFQVATSSIDNTVRIWDLRKRKCGYTLPAHSNIITDLRYSTNGELLLTASFDGSLKTWASRDYHIVRTLTGHSGKVMSCDFAPDQKHIVSAGYDRTIKLWAHKDEF